MATDTRRTARGIAPSGNAGRFDVKGLARASGLNFDGVSLDEPGSNSAHNRFNVAAAATDGIEQARRGDGKSLLSQPTITVGTLALAQSATTAVEAGGRTTAPNVAPPTADALNATKLSAVLDAHHLAPGSTGSSAPLPLINTLTVTQGQAAQSLGEESSASATSDSGSNADSSATATAASVVTFENLDNSGATTTNGDDTTTTVTLDDAVAGGTPGTATITAHVDHAVTGDDLILNLSNGATITIAVGATSGTSGSFAALADATIGITSQSGGAFTALDTSDTALVAINNAPVNAFPGAQTVAEDTDLAITGLSISDADAGSAISITVALSVANGTLTVSPAGGAAVSGSGTGSVTLTGSIDEINTTLAAADNVVYRGAPDFNGNDTLSITTDDHGNTGIDPGLTGTTSSEQDADTVPITVTAVNDAPVATITPASYSASEQTSLNLKNNGLAIGDVDAASGSMTVTLSVSEGTLTVTPGGSGAVVSDSGTPSVTITGTLAQIDHLLNSDATSMVSYSDNTDTPSPSATLTLSVHDNGNAGGGDLLASDTATINIAAVNDAPVLSLTPIVSHNVQDQFASQAYDLNTGDVNWSGSWTESESTSPTSGSIRIADPDVAGTNLALRLGDDTNSVTADVTIVRSADLTGATSATLSFDYDQVKANSGEDLIVNAWNGSDFVEIGRILGASADGLGSFSAALDQAYIAADTQIQFVAMGSLDSNEFYYVDNVNIAYTNEPSFTEGGPALVLDGGAMVSDSELDALNNYDGATLTVARNGAANAEDEFSGSGPLSLSAGDVVYDSATVGTYTQSSGMLVIAFNGNATNAQVDGVLQNIAYSNTSDAPPASVEITYTFSDGNSGAQGSGGAHSSSGSVAVDLVGVNDAPAISGLTISESSIDFVATDPDSATLSLVSPFDTSFGDPHVSSGAVASLTPMQQSSVVSGTLEVTDGLATGSVVDLYLGRSAGNSFTAGDVDTAIYGFAGKDTLTGGLGKDWIFGGDGNDTIVGAQNDWVLDGGNGTDTLKVGQDFASTSDAQIANIENVALTAAATLNLANQTESFTITGSSGADTIVAGSGDDTITGDDGADTMTGGAGADTFIIKTGQSTATPGGSGNNGTITGYDVITDFATGTDTLDLQGNVAVAVNTAGTNGADSALTIDGQTVKSHAITNGIVTFDDNNAFNVASILNLTSLADVAAAVDYLNGNDIGAARSTVAFMADLAGVTNTFIYEQISSGTPSSESKYLLVDLENVTLTSGGISLSSLVSDGRIAPAGVAGAPINLALSEPGDHVGAVAVTISSLPDGWAVSEGADNGHGSWTVATDNVGALSITAPADYAGAMTFNVALNWTNTDGSSDFTMLADNVEAYVPGNPIFAIAGDDNLTGSSGADLMVFAQPIGHDTIYNFDVAHDQVDLMGFAGTMSFSDTEAHLASDGNGSAVLTLGEGMTITFSGTEAGTLGPDNFAFDMTPVTTNAGNMTLGDGTILPLSGIVENSGTIELSSLGATTELQIVDRGVTLEGGGSLVFSDSGGNIVSGIGADALFTNVDNTISGAGHLGNGQMMLENRGSILASGVNALEIDTGANPVINSGILEATGNGGLVIHGNLSNSGLLWANGGNITIKGDVTSSGSALITGDAAFECDGQFSATITIDTNASATLAFKGAADFGGAIVGFNSDDQIHIADIAAGDATLSYAANSDGTGGLLTVSDGTHAATIALAGQYAAGEFQLASDADAGTAIVYVAHDHHIV